MGGKTVRREAKMKKEICEQRVFDQMGMFAFHGYLIKDTSNFHANAIIFTEIIETETELHLQHLIHSFPMHLFSPFFITLTRF